MHEAIHMYTGFTRCEWMLYCCCIFFGVTSGIHSWKCNELAIQPQPI